MEAQKNSKRASARQNSDENALLRLAKKQGMNTEIRRSIFVVLMSSDVRDLKQKFTSLLTRDRIMLMHVSDSPS